MNYFRLINPCFMHNDSNGANFILKTFQSYWRMFCASCQLHNIFKAKLFNLLLKQIWYQDVIEWFSRKVFSFFFAVSLCQTIVGVYILLTIMLIACKRFDDQIIIVFSFSLTFSLSFILFLFAFWFFIIFPFYFLFRFVSD